MSTMMKEADVAYPQVELPDLMSQPIDEVDPTQQIRFATDTQDAMFARLRKERPVQYLKDSQYGPLWNVTRYKDIVDIEIDYATFSSDVSNGGILIKDLPKDMLRTSFINADPPIHDDQRKVVAPVVAPGNLQRMEEKIRNETNQILDSLPVGETFDWVDRVSIELTGRVLAELMDTPRDERRLLTYWSDIVNVDLAVGGDINTEEARYAKLKECAAYFGKLFNERKQKAPGPDLISMLAHSPATASMPPQEFLGMIVLLMVGGNDTTRNSITGGLLALSQFPEQYAKLRANPKLAGNMVPEIIRWVTPVPHMRRTVTKDAEFRGQKMKKGDKVVIWYMSGNRDEEMISDPFQFDIERKNPRAHLSFGMGIHRCLGNRLAELQLKILWEEILKRPWIIDVVGPAKRKYACNLRGFSAMPVQIRAV